MSTVSNLGNPGQVCPPSDPAHESANTLAQAPQRRADLLVEAAEHLDKAAAALERGARQLRLPGAAALAAVVRALAQGLGGAPLDEEDLPEKDHDLEQLARRPGR